MPNFLHDIHCSSQILLRKFPYDAYNYKLQLHCYQIGYHNFYNGVILPTPICVMVRVRLQGIKTSKITDLHTPTANDYKQGSKFIVLEAPDLPLHLPCRHFFCAYLYSLPHLQVLICSPCCFVHVILCAFAPLVSRSVSSDSVLPCSPCILCSICCGGCFYL